MPPETKKWIEEYGRRHHLSAAEVIRRALELYRRHGSSAGTSQDVLARTQGKWSSVAGDSQAYVRFAVHAPQAPRWMGLINASRFDQQGPAQDAAAVSAQLVPG